jgi:hypothetical protein
MTVAELGLCGADAAVTATLYVEFGFDELLMDLLSAVIEEVEGGGGRPVVGGSMMVLWGRRLTTSGAGGGRDRGETEEEEGLVVRRGRRRGGTVQRRKNATLATEPRACPLAQYGGPRKNQCQLAMEIEQGIAHGGTAAIAAGFEFCLPPSSRSG